MGSRSIFQHVCFCQDWREWLMLRFQPWRKKSSTLASSSKADLLFSAPSNLSSRNIFHGILLTSDNYWTPKCCHDTVFFVLSAKLERQMSTIVELLPYFKNIFPQTESEKLGVWLSRSIWRGRAPRFVFLFWNNQASSVGCYSFMMQEMNSVNVMDAYIYSIDVDWCRSHKVSHERSRDCGK